jgi:hypothetical protein
LPQHSPLPDSPLVTLQVDLLQLQHLAPLADHQVDLLHLQHLAPLADHQVSQL